MGVMIGLIVGYVMGTRAGDNGLHEMKEAWSTIRSSEEARALLIGGLSIAGGLLSKGGGLLIDRLQSEGSGGASVSTLRPTG